MLLAWQRWRSSRPLKPENTFLPLQAFKELAKVHHPDKGGNAQRFSLLLHAFQVLGDPEKRKVYDDSNTEARYIINKDAYIQVSQGHDAGRAAMAPRSLVGAANW